MSSSTQLRMHQDHRQWQSENAFWRDQIREWQQQTAKAVGDVAVIRSALAEHERMLEKHAAAVRLYEQQSAQHECRLAETPQEATSGLSASEHGCEACQHFEVRERHENLKQLHHTLMARWALLLKALGAES
jgi:hypothetical protein